MGQANRRYQSLREDRQRRRLNSQAANSQDHNHNHSAPIEDGAPAPPVGMNLPDLNLATSQDGGYNDALDQLKCDMDVHEKELLAKKKAETFAVTQQRMAGVQKSIEDQFICDPHLIGTIPGLKNQQRLAFNCWIQRFKNVVLGDELHGMSAAELAHKIMKLQRNADRFERFLADWVIVRIVHDDTFAIVWAMVKEHLDFAAADALERIVSLVMRDPETEQEEKAETEDKGKEPMDL